MKKNVSLLLLILTVNALFSGTIPDSLLTTWKNPGYQGVIPNPTNVKNILNFGGLNDNTGNNTTALTNAIASLSGNLGVIYFPAGTYRFTSGVNLPANIVIRGAGSDSSIFNFNLGGNGDLISITGSQTTTQTIITNGLNKGDTNIIVSSNIGFNVGDYAIVKEDGNTLMASSWAYNTMYQMVKIKAINGTIITLEKPLRITFLSSLNPILKKILPKQNVGIECIKINREDATTGQTNNIIFTNAANCWVKGIESNNCNYAHIDLNSCIHITISENYIHHAFSYGDGGKGYGYVVEFGSSENLIYNNIAEHLRHSFLFQAAANGNVVSYNYSFDPNWTQSFFPANSAGDIVFHGNYNFSNLVEGNICQHIVIDNSHGYNGPYNTFFRNRSELYGVFMNSGAGDKNNFVGNDVTNTGFLLGNFVMDGSNYLYGNRIRGSAESPSGTSILPENTLYNSSYTVPIGTNYTYNTGTNNAFLRNSTSIKTQCPNLSIILAKKDTLRDTGKINTIKNNVVIPLEAGMTVNTAFVLNCFGNQSIATPIAGATIGTIQINRTNATVGYNLDTFCVSICNAVLCDTTILILSTFTDIPNSLKNKSNLEVHLFPNPANSILHLKLNDAINTENLSIKLFTINGKIVLENLYKKYNKNTEIDISKLENGIYFMYISDGKQETVEKIIIEK